jgi:hypothetical protein
VGGYFLNSPHINTSYIKKNAEALRDASKEVGLEVNTEKTKCMLKSHYQNAGQNHNIKIANRSVGCQFWYFERQPDTFLMNASEALAALGWLV